MSDEQSEDPATPTDVVTRNPANARRIKSARERGGRARAVERNEARRRQSARLVRTILLGTVAMVAGVFWVGEQYDVEREVLLEFLLTSFLFVAMLVAAGFFGTLLLRGVRRLLGR